MTINITIIVQIFHFIIGYFIITKIVLVPAIKIIRQEQKNENILLNELKSIDDKIFKKEYQKISLINNFSSQFQQSKPKIKSYETNPVPLSEQKAEFDPNKIEALRKTLFDVLIDKVKHVN